MSDLHEIFQAFTPSLHDVSANRCNVLATLGLWINWRFRYEIGFEAVAHGATEYQVLELTALAALGLWHEVILGGHYKTIEVSP